MFDTEIREALCDYLDEKYGKVRLIDELTVGKARADIVAVTDILTGYEIKGDGDSYARLPGQIREYDRHFQRNAVVVGPSHRKSASAHVPPYWGIFFAVKPRARGAIHIEEARESCENPKFNIKNQLNILWRPEIINILRRNKLPLCAGKTKPFMVKFLLEKIQADTVAAEICAELFEREWAAGR